MKSKKRDAGPLKDLSRQSVCLANQIAAAIYTAANTQISSEMSSALAGGDYQRIVSASVDPRDYNPKSDMNVDMFRRDYLCVEMMSKFPNWDLGIDRSAVALSKFSEVELHLSSLKFSCQNPVFVALGKRATLQSVLATARRKIDKILGEFSLDEVHSLFAFGPGASTSLKRRRANASYKFGAERPQLSYNAIPLADALAKAHPTWRFEGQVVSGSKLITVPKNAKTDRTICIEPDLNMYFQKGLGAAIRRRLQRWNLLKRDAQAYNARLALEGSANGLLATVDLSSASDSIHLGLVRELLPPSWVDFVELTRSPQVVLPSGDLYLLRKVSSMGNGFTFELETLIFYSLCSAVIELFASRDTDHRCTVFGDDILISPDLVPVLEEIFVVLGFSMNTKKTFSTGWFRESCGKHYFAGHDVTPFYIRSAVDTIPRKYWAANTVKRYSRLPWGLDPTYHETYRLVVESIPTYFRGFKIPEGVGDGGLVTDWDEARPSRSSAGHDAWHFKHVVPHVKRKRLNMPGTLLKILHSLEFPRLGPDVDNSVRLLDRKIGVILAGQRMVMDQFKLGGNPYADWSELNDLLAYLAKLDGLGASYLPFDPVQTGWRVSETGKTQRWESFGPWLS